MPADQESGRKPQKPRALIVEDEFVILLSLRVQLEAIGCEVVGTARNADIAVEQARRLQPDIVIMDIGLPGKDGAEAAREIIADRWTPIIIVTAYGDERVDEAVQAGACVVLTKPIVQEQLARAVEQARNARPGPACG
jgi:response regulator NasT